MIILKACDIQKNYGKRKSLFCKDSRVCALNKVSLSLSEGKTMALIGETGSGKSTLGRIIAGLEKPCSGEVWYRNKIISGITGKKMRPHRQHIQMIFQNSTNIFDSYQNIGESLKESLNNFEKLSPEELNNRIGKMLTRVGLEDSFQNRYAEELSGGQRQRANIARALILKPELLICDEPVANLDYSVRKQVLDLIKGMKQELNLTCLLITHDLSNVNYMCDSMAVMYLGSIIEYMETTNDIQKRIRHPYTKMLFDAIPIKNPNQRKEYSEKIDCKGEERESYQKGCKFYYRCKIRQDICLQKEPVMNKYNDGHWLACHKFN